MKLYEVFHTHGRMVAFTGETKDGKARVVELPTGKCHTIPREVLENASQMTQRIDDA